MSLLRLHDFLEFSRVNGPGLRSVLWVQGCLRDCPQCFNPETHQLSGGREYSLDALIAMIPFAEIDGVSISGGEPFLQPGPLSGLAQEVRNRDLQVLCYTGYCYEDLIISKDPELQRFLGLIDILIDGPYVSEISAVHAWCGSGNQRVLFLKQGKILQEDTSLSGYRDLEFIIGDDGSVVQTGF